MDAEGRREASRAFGDILRVRVAENRGGLRLEDLTGRTGAEQGTTRGERDEPPVAEDGAPK